MVRVGNIYTEKYNPTCVYVYVGRSTSYNKASRFNALDFSRLGNPYNMRFESQRDEVCDKFSSFFNREVNIRDSEIRCVFTTLWNLYKKCINDNKTLILLCFCSPRRCHADKLVSVLIECEMLTKGDR